MKGIIKFILLLILLLCTQSLLVADIVVIKDSVKRYKLGLHVSYYTDKTGKLTINDVLAPEFKKRFIKSQKEIPDLGISTATRWLHFSLYDQSYFHKKWLLLIELLFISNIEVYKVIPHTDNIEKVLTQQSLSKNKLHHRLQVFSLDTLKNKKIHYYIKVRVGGKSIFPISIVESSHFNYSVQKEYIILGIYYGLIFVMILYNILLFFIFRDKNYLFYSIHILTFLTWQFSFNGLGYEFFWPNNLYFHLISPFIFSPLVLLTILIFTKSFLETKERTPILDKIIILLEVLCLIEFLLFLTGYINSFMIKFANFLNGIVTIVIFVTSIISWIKGYRPARYFAIAWSAFSLGMLYFNLFMLDIVPYSFFAYYMIQIGSAIEVILFSAALTDHVNELRVEKDEALTKTIEIQKVANITLEKKVNERTKDLNSAKLFIEKLIAESPIAIHVIDKNGNITLENPAMKKIIFNASESLLGKNIKNLPNHNTGEFNNIYINALKGIPCHKNNLKLTTIKNKEYFINLIVTPLFDSNTNEVDCVMSMYYDNTERALTEYKLERALKTIYDDLTLAEKIQENIISYEYKKYKAIDIDVYFQPMIEVGGDIYDIYKLDDNNYRIFIADSEGHGVQAALTIMIVKTEYDKIKLFGLPPNQILHILNTTYIRQYKKLESYFTCAILDINIKKRSISYASGGHPEQIFIHNDKINHVKTDGPLIGLKEDSLFDLKTYTFKKGDKFFLYTDGIVEIINENYQIFGLRGLGEILINDLHKPISDMVKSTVETIEMYQGELPTTDDKTLIGIQL